MSDFNMPEKIIDYALMLLVRNLGIPFIKKWIKEAMVGLMIFIDHHLLEPPQQIFNKFFSY